MITRSLKSCLFGLLTASLALATGCADDDAPATELCADPQECSQARALTSSNAFGAWLFYLEQTGMSWTELADTLQQQGVKRIFIKVADGANTCAGFPQNLFPETCDPAVPQVFASRGIEAWAWSYNYPGSTRRQAEALYYAAQHGYAGFILDIETEFDGTSRKLQQLMEAFAEAKDAAVRDGHASTQFLMGATTWGNPKDHGMRVDIIDQYVDFHMPQTYIELWGGPWLANPAYSIEVGNCEYRELGAQKPIWHIVSAEYGQISGATLDEFFRWAGPNASIWRIPGDGVATSIWQDWNGIDWNRTSFDATACSSGNAALPGLPLGPTP